MRVVIDANVFKDFYRETVLSRGSALSESAVELFSRVLSKTDIAYVDVGGQILHEWGNLVDKEWFDTWIADQIRDDKIKEIPSPNVPGIRRRLIGFGIPPTRNRDIWYVRVASEILRQNGAADYAFIVSEDLHFYDPRRLRDDNNRVRRINHMTGGRGPVFQYLRNDHNIYVLCVFSYNRYPR